MQGEDEFPRVVRIGGAFVVPNDDGQDALVLTEEEARVLRDALSVALGEGFNG